MTSQARPAAFFDRDGTINVYIGYLHRIDDVRWVQGAPEAILRHNLAGDLVVVVTNQSGIARGYFTAEEVEALHEQMNEKLRKDFGAHVDRFYYCPHHPDYTGECSCRKPKPGMLLRAIGDLGIDPSISVMYGDSESDCEAAEQAGIARFVRVSDSWRG